MATRGPASVLDNRESDGSVNIVRDRITRHRSPARDYKRYSYGSDCSEEAEINLRVSQPYRTSFSAVVSPTRTKRDRSRSTSPCTSSLKGSARSRSKSPGGKRSHKHVTYDDRVVIRDSGTSDSIITNLSDKDYSDSSVVDSAFISDMSNSSPRDYATELRELSKQIVQEYSTSPEAEKSSGDASSQGKRQNHVNGAKQNGRVVEAGVQGRPGKKQVQRKDHHKLIVQEEYDNDRLISYRMAIKNNYSDDIKKEAAHIMEEVKQPEVVKSVEKPPPKVVRERRNSLPTQDPALESNRLTHSKRSISSSIGNFFRRMSPHAKRRSKKLGKGNSQSLSHADDLDSSFDRTGSTNSLSRGKLRRSLMKLFGKSKKGNNSLNKSDLSVEDLNQSNNSADDYAKPTKHQKPALYMKSIEQTSKSDKDVYHKFKERQTRESTGPTKPQALKASPRVPSPDTEPNMKEKRRSVDQVDRAEPPQSLDVRTVPKSVKSLQASQFSAISIDDSIGDCSIDPNLTGSEPSLVSQTSTSKQVALSQASRDAVSPTQQSPTRHHIEPVQEQIETPKSYSVNKSKPCKDLNLSYAQMPLTAETTEYYPKDIVRTPSYLRLSSTIGGYGHYSKYSAYQGIVKRSPYSSTLSLRSSRSDLAIPISPTEMPIGKILNIQAPTNYPPLKAELFSPKSDENEPPKFDSVDSAKPITNGASDLEHINGQDVNINGDVNGGVNAVENGHGTNVMVNSFVSSGDTIKDADYFLNLAEVEERRLLLLCSKCEMEAQDEGITEEASGKIRAAVGKANLLTTQKFRQFQDLCEQHKNPEPGSKLTKCEDLQGFWEMVKIQVDDVDEMFTEIDLMRQNGWREIKVPSRRSSSSSRSSPKSGTGSLSVSNTSTPSHTPGSRRKAAKLKDTPESSPERSQKAKMTAKAREEARKKMLAEKRAAMKQQKLQQSAEDVEIYVADNTSKSNSPSRTNGAEV